MRPAESSRLSPIAAVASATSPAKLPRLLYYLGMVLLAELTLRPVAGFTVSDLIFFAALVTLLLQQGEITATSLGFLPPALLYGVLLFAVGAVFSSFASTQTPASLAVTGRFIYLTVVWFWLGAALVRTSGQVVVAILMWTMSAAVSGFAAVGQVVNLLPALPFFGRLTGLTGHPNDLGGLAAVALTPAIMMATRPGCRTRTRVFANAVLAGIVAGLILSGSVGALIAAIGGSGLFLAVAFRRRSLSRVSKRYFLVALLAVIAVSVWLLVQPGSSAYSPASRVLAVTGQQDRPGEVGTLFGRLLIDQSAAGAIAQHPLLGSGLDVDAAYQEVDALVHNMFLGVWFGGGLPALIGLLIILGSLCLVLAEVLQNARSNQEQLVGLALMGALLAFVLLGMSSPILYVRYGWVPGALLIAMRAGQRRDISAPQNVTARATVSSRPGSSPLTSSEVYLR